MSGALVRAGRAFVELFADKSKLVKGLKSAERDLKAFGAGVTRIGKTIAAAGAAMAIPLGIATRIFAGFDDQMRAVRAVTGSTGAQFDALTEKAKKLGATTSYSAQAVAAGMLELGRAGFDASAIDASGNGACGDCAGGGGWRCQKLA